MEQNALARDSGPQWGVEEFVASLAARDCSAATVRAYRGDVARFVRWSSERGISQPREVAHRTLREYLASMNVDGDQRTSISRRRASLRRYFSWALERGFLDVDPSARISAPRPHSVLPEIVGRQQLDQLLDEKWGEDPWALRDRAVCELLYGAGLRVSELCGLNDDDLDAPRGVLKVLGKGRKERVVPLHSLGWKALERWRDVRAQVLTPEFHLWSSSSTVEACA